MRSADRRPQAGDKAIVREGRADMVALARAFLADPRWGGCAATFSETITAPQLARSVTTMQH
ncbi:hypothetical protein ACFSQT_31970 [Mesorhizobium calcicola]|uniref:Uncharacterized protein n=1 Tax=Mesorhizobium calcicola TaxID=1300310 RepID=A0ABW4WM97_9HYPH